MRSLIRGVCALALVSSVGIPAANAGGVPDPGSWTVPTSIMLVGQSGGVSDPFGSFEVIIRDLAQNPLWFVRVDVDFSQATDVRLSAIGDPGSTVLCEQHWVRAITDQNGRARFTIRGGSRAGPASSVAPSVRIWADGVMGNAIPATTPDLDGINGVGAGDLSIFLDDFFSQLNPPRSDFNYDGIVGGSDFAKWLQVFTAGGSTASDPSCP